MGQEANCMMTSSNVNIFRVTGHLRGEFTCPGEFPAQRPVTQSFDAFIDLRLNKQLSKQSWSWWFETLSHPLWRHRNGVNSLGPSDAIWHQRPWSSLAQEIVCYLLSATLVSESMPIYCQLESKEHIWIKCYLKFTSFHWRKCIWKCLLLKGWPFCFSMT